MLRVAALLHAEGVRYKNFRGWWDINKPWGDVGEPTKVKLWNYLRDFEIDSELLTDELKTLAFEIGDPTNCLKPAYKS